MAAQTLTLSPNPHSNSLVPPIWSITRLTTLFASLLVALSAGTNYVYSAYAPQLGARLRINHTQLNMIGLGGNMGVYLSGPIWGRIVDTRGPKFPLAAGFVLLLSGYSGIRMLYNAGPASDVTAKISLFALTVLVVCGFMTGAGGNAGLTGGVNATAKTFPDRARATTTGIVLSGFGLSAFLFSTLAHLIFPGDTSSFLLLLSLGTSIPMIVGYFLVKPIPLPMAEILHQHQHHGEHDEVEVHAAGIDAAAVLPHLDGDGEDEEGGDRDDEQTRLLEEAGSDERRVPSTPAEQFIPDARGSLEMSRSRSRPRSPPGKPAHRYHSHSHYHEGLPNVYGRALFGSKDFWLLFVILSLLSGTGLMYINNVGSMSQVLYAKGNTEYDEIEAAQWQAAQVSAISVMNFSGRIIIGLISDFAKNRLKFPRSYSLVLVSLFFLTSQLTASSIEDVRDLWKASAVLGLAHGSVFSLFPTVCIEWFGLPHFSENWGYLSVSPVFGGNLFSLAFGRNLDAHSPLPEAEVGVGGSVRVREESASQCLDGKECYVATLHLTAGACFLALLLSIWAGWRERQRLTAQTSRRRGSMAPAPGRTDDRDRSNGEVLWEGGD